MNPNRYIYHITSAEAWRQAQPVGWYAPPGFAADGFIHCSKLRQAPRVAERFYAGQTGLVLLQIQTDRLDAKVIYENLEGGAELYPHIYGKLKVQAVSRVIPFTPDPHGSFPSLDWLEMECPG